jgi:hypothetical protein
MFLLYYDKQQNFLRKEEEAKMVLNFELHSGLSAYRIIGFAGVPVFRCSVIPRIRESGNPGIQESALQLFQLGRKPFKKNKKKIFIMEDNQVVILSSKLKCIHRLLTALRDEKSDQRVFCENAKRLMNVIW